MNIKLNGSSLSGLIWLMVRKSFLLTCWRW